MRGGIEAIYDDMPQPIGMMNFAPLKAARGSMFGAAHRLGRSGARRLSAAKPSCMVPKARGC